MSNEDRKSKMGDLMVRSGHVQGVGIWESMDLSLNFAVNIKLL